jgi:hypothetical protein
MIAPPVAGLDAFVSADRRHAQPIEEAVRSGAFGVAQAPMNLLDTDRRRKWDVSMVADRRESRDGAGPASQHVD